jgi:hypothetical protein
LRDEDSVSRTTCECTHQHLKNFCSWWRIKLAVKTLF